MRLALDDYNALLAMRNARDPDLRRARERVRALEAALARAPQLAPPKHYGCSQCRSPLHRKPDCTAGRPGIEQYERHKLAHREITRQRDDELEALRGEMVALRCLLDYLRDIPAVGPVLPVHAGR